LVAAHLVEMIAAARCPDKRANYACGAGEILILQAKTGWMGSRLTANFAKAY
jgi:hypothetical protein